MRQKTVVVVVVSVRRRRTRGMLWQRRRGICTRSSSMATTTHAHAHGPLSIFQNRSRLFLCRPTVASVRGNIVRMTKQTNPSSSHFCIFTAIHHDLMSHLLHPSHSQSSLCPLRDKYFAKLEGYFLSRNWICVCQILKFVSAAANTRFVA